MACDDQADWKKFKRWLRRELSKAGECEDFSSKNEAIYGSEVGISHGDWNEKAKFTTEMAVFNYDFTYFMSKDELKAYKGEKPAKLVPPKMFDLSKAERVFVNKEDIKLKEMEKESNRLKDV